MLTHLSLGGWGGVGWGGGWGFQNVGGTSSDMNIRVQTEASEAIRIDNSYYCYVLISSDHSSESSWTIIFPHPHVLVHYCLYHWSQGGGGGVICHGG